MFQAFFPLVSSLLRGGNNAEGIVGGSEPWACMNGGTENDMDLDNIDTSEERLLRPDGILDILLKDRTTGGNIIWATGDYSDHGEAYGAKCPIRTELITGKNATLIQPRIKKEREARRLRSRDKAEVFTPAWVCNKQNNLIDRAWFGKEGVFNTENEDNTWTPAVPLKFPEGKTLNAYVSDVRLELTCGEAPYLVSRYDATTGMPIPVGQRIGLLDRKLWAINCLTPDDSKDFTPKERKQLKREWRRRVYRAYQSVYGFEWQGDNLFLAREALFVSFVEYYRAKWKVKRLPDEAAKFFLIPLVGYLFDANRHRLNSPMCSKLSVYPFAAS